MKRKPVLSMAACLAFLLGNSLALATMAATDDEILNQPKQTPDKDEHRFSEEGKRTRRPPRGWIVEQYPNPNDFNDMTEFHRVCHTTSTRLCDIDAVLTEKDKAEIVSSLDLARRSTDLCATEETDAAIEIQFAVTLLDKMDLTAFGEYDDRQTKAAQTFGQVIHDRWGVGLETSCGGTGVVIFLSFADRAIFISRGRALEKILTNARLDRTIRNMKPFLRHLEYKEALLHAISELDSLIERGAPDTWERFQDFLAAWTGLFWVMGILSYVVWNIRNQHVERRRYAQVTSHLNEIDRARALALQGQYQAVSCPICFEAFGKEEGDENFTKGSDGKPIKLLRCGHVFDETCWESWVASGQGQFDKCPICKQDVGSTGSDTNGTQATNQRLGINNNNGGNGNRVIEQREAEQRALRQYNFERQFRLARLGRRYPQYIGPRQIQRWTQSTYDGPLARDPTFVQNNPTVRGGNGMRGGSRGRVGGSSSGFGGGSSGGGRGGRW